MWTTPQAHDTTKRGAGNRANPNAGNACLGWDAEKWATPVVRDTRSPDREGSWNFARKVAEGVTIDLNSQAANWATPTSRDAKDGACSAQDVPTNALLGRQAARWDGPALGPRFPATATDGRASSPVTRASPRLWPTATASEARHDGPNQAATEGAETLSQAARKLWPTATAGDANSSGAAAYSTESGRHPGTTLTDATTRATPNARLSPTFVEWMQNFPRDWTDLRGWTPTGPTGSGLSETRSSQSKQGTPSPGSGAGSTGDA